MTDDIGLERSATPFIGGILLATTVFIGIDVAGDLANGAGLAHVGTELLVTIFAAIGVVVLVIQAVRARRRLHQLSTRLDHASAEAVRWRKETEGIVRGLSAAIDDQFERWGLTPAEREIGMLLLKGLSLRDIAAARETSERTVRQQTLAIYRKSELTGRAELAAFFLEDLLLPTGQREERPNRGA